MRTRPLECIPHDEEGSVSSCLPVLHIVHSRVTATTSGSDMSAAVGYGTISRNAHG